MYINTLKKRILHITANSNVAKNNLSFREQLYLYHGVSKLSNPQVIDLYLKLYEDVEPPKPNPKIQKYLNVALYIACTIIPVPLLSDIVVYLVNKHNWRCIVRCQKDPKEINKRLCYDRCKVGSYQWAVQMLQKELKKCNNHEEIEKRKKCRDSLFKLLITWRGKLVKAKINLKTTEKEAKQEKSGKMGWFRR